MFWRRLLARWWRGIGAFRQGKTHLDQKLVFTVHPKRLPRWSQLKYLGSFLSAKEKQVLSVCLAVSGLAFLAAGIVFIVGGLTPHPESGGSLTEGIVGQPKYLNPIFAASSDVDRDLTALLYTGLFRIGEKNSIIPALAESYTVSDDNKIFTIKLRDDVKWSDGKPFTADDVIFTFTTIQNPEVGSPLFAAFQGTIIEKINNRTVSFTLKEPFGLFLYSLTTEIIPEHIWGEIPAAGLKLAKNNLQPVGIGPFVVNKFTKDATGNIQSYSLEKNNNYFGSRPYLDSINFQFFNDITELLDALRSQQIQAIGLVPPVLQNKISSKTTTLYPLYLPQYTALFFNEPKQALLKNYNLRAALDLAIDKNKLIIDSLHGNGRPLAGPFTEGSIGYEATSTSQSPNFQRAQEILDRFSTRLEPEEYFRRRLSELTRVVATSTSTGEDDASSTIPNSDDLAATIRQEMPADQAFYRESKDKSILRLTITTADSPEYRAVSDFITAAWRALGIQVNTLFVPSRQINRNVIRLRDYEILLYSEVVGSDGDPFAFWHSSQTDYPGLNLSRYANRAADKLLEEARATRDETKRALAYKKFQALLVEDLPAIFLYQPNYFYALNKTIKGVNMGTLGTPADRFKNIANWYIKTSWTWK